MLPASMLTVGTRVMAMDNTLIGSETVTCDQFVQAIEEQEIGMSGQCRRV
jgi:hypothetical protein